MNRLNPEARMTIKTLAARGASNSHIARLLGVTEGAVRHHVARLQTGALDGRSRQEPKAACVLEAEFHSPIREAGNGDAVPEHIMHPMQRRRTCAVREGPNLPCATDESCRRSRLTRVPGQEAGQDERRCRGSPWRGRGPPRARGRGASASLPVELLGKTAMRLCRRPRSKRRMTDQQARGGRAPWPDDPARHPGTSRPRSSSGASSVTPIGTASMIHFTRSRSRSNPIGSSPWE